jgi:hypothetical protein
MLGQQLVTHCILVKLQMPSLLRGPGAPPLGEIGVQGAGVGGPHRRPLHRWPIRHSRSHRLLVGDQLVFLVLVLVLVLFVVLSGAAGRPALAALLGQLLLAVLDVVERGAEEALLLVLDSRQLVLDSVQLAVELLLLDVQVLEVVLYRLNLSARALASAL